MTIRYLFHSCFVAESSDTIVVIDYWHDRDDGRLHHLLEETSKQVYFVVSHFHPDHYNPQILRCKLPVDDNDHAACNHESANKKRLYFRLRRKPLYLLSYDVVKRRRIFPALPAAVLRPGHHYEDDNLELHAYRSTDIGISMALRLKADEQGETLFHCGDLNNWYFSEEGEGPEHLKVSLQQMEGLFLSVVRELEKVYPDGLQHLCFPVDPRLGKDMLRGATQWLYEIPANNFYPMHFWGKYEAMAEGLKQLQEMFPRTTFHLPEDIPEAYHALSEHITSL